MLTSKTNSGEVTYLSLAWPYETYENGCYIMQAFHNAMINMPSQNQKEE